MPSEKILIVEDCPINMKLATSLLEKSDYVVLQAENAEKGIALAKAEKPALILMDVRLPGMNGLKATRLLKQDPATKDIPIIALTAHHVLMGDGGKSLTAGCDDYIAKPFNRGALLEMVARYISDCGLRIAD